MDKGLFDLCVSISTHFNIAVTTKLHRLMRHVDRHIGLLSCLRRGSSDDIEMAHKEFKSVYDSAKKTA